MLRHMTKSNNAHLLLALKDLALLIGSDARNPRALASVRLLHHVLDVLRPLLEDSHSTCHILALDVVTLLGR